MRKGVRILTKLTKNQQDIIARMRAVATKLEMEAARGGGAYGRIRVETLASHDEGITRRRLQTAFGSVDNAMRMAGLHPVFPSEEELLEIIQCFIEQNGRAPGPTDAFEGRLLYSERPYQQKFGSIAKAVQKIGHAPLGRGVSTDPEHHQSLKNAKPVVWHCKSASDED